MTDATIGPFQLGRLSLAAELSAKSALLTDHGLTVEGLLVGILGVVVTVIGLIIAINQIKRVRSASEEARIASGETRMRLRTADLRRLIVESFAVEDRLNLTRRVVDWNITAEDWKRVYSRITALLDREPGLPKDEVEAMKLRLEKAATELLVAQDSAASKSSWDAYSPTTLRRVFSEYRSAAETFLIAADDQLVG